MILTGFSFFSAITIIYVLVELTNTIMAANNGAPEIPIETGLYYLFILNIFFAFSFIQYKTKRNIDDKINNYAGQFIAICFIASLVIGFIIPIFLDEYLIDKGYKKQLESKNSSFEEYRLFAGESLLYKKQ